METERRRRFQVIIDFTADDSGTDASALYEALAAQAYEADGVTDVDMEWIEGELVAVPAGETALLSWILLPTLHDVAWLASCAFKLATGYGDVAWLSFDADLDLIRSDLGTMRLSDFRMYYNEGAIG